MAFPNPANNLSILHKLPTEIFERVCHYLEPIWLMNLSITCRGMSVKLSLEAANKIWYDALPTSIWRSSERHQNELELLDLWMRNNIPGFTFDCVEGAVRDHQLIRT